jgi:hypothetical protein
MENEIINNKKDVAKEKIILFVIGVLVGAVISTGSFFAYIKLAGIGSSSSNNGQPSEMQGGGTPPEMPSGENGQGAQGEPPEKPSDNNSTSN